VKNVKDFDDLVTTSIENQVISVNAPPDSSMFVSFDDWKRQSIFAERSAPFVKGID